MMKLSVIICTYNPDKAIFKKCLDQIAEASKQFTPFEIIIVDNNSTIPISSHDYINSFLGSWSMARIVIEEKQGLTPARLRGITESNGDLLIFVDDDNFIDSDYFARAAEISTTYPFIGAFSGRVTLTYDREPEE